MVAVACPSTCRRCGSGPEVRRLWRCFGCVLLCAPWVLARPVRGAVMVVVTVMTRAVVVAMTVAVLLRVVQLALVICGVTDTQVARISREGCVHRLHTFSHGSRQHNAPTRPGTHPTRRGRDNNGAHHSNRQVGCAVRCQGRHRRVNQVWRVRHRRDPQTGGRKHHFRQPKRPPWLQFETW